MKLHRLVIAFIVLSGSAVLIAGAYFPKPTFPSTPATAAVMLPGSPMAPAAEIAAKP